MKRVASHPDPAAKESGMALVTVLLLLVIVSLLAASAVSISQYAEMDAATFSSFTRSSYVAEGAAHRLYWLIQHDRRQYPQRNIAAEPSSEFTAAERRYIADAMPYEMTLYDAETVQYVIRDAVAGIDVSGNMPQRDLTAMFQNLDPGSEERTRWETVANRLQDYADADDLLRLNGMEAAEYQAAELWRLPRNRPLQFREELLWIPGFRELFPPDEHGRLSVVRLIAPYGLSPVNGRPNLYSSPLNQIADRARLSAMEKEALEEAFRLYQTEGKPLRDSLIPGLLNRLEMYFGSSESGIYTLLIDTSGPHRAGMRLAVSFKAAFGTKGPLEIYEFMLY